MFARGGPTFLELARQALSSTERGYDLLAPKFELTPFRTPDSVLRAAAGFVTDPVDDILDLCCGTGAALRAFQHLARCSIVGLDTSRGMLEEARRLTPGLHGGAKVQFVRGDALALTFGRDLDVAISFGAFGHILESDEPRLVSEIFRVLRPGGRFIFATSDMPSVFEASWWMARVFKRFPGAFQKVTVLRIQDRRFFWRETEELAVEHLHRREWPTGADIVRLAQILGRLALRQELLIGEGLDGLDAVANVPPELVDVTGASEPRRDPDDCDVVFRV